TFRHQVKDVIDSIIRKSEFCKGWRNKVIAHKDYYQTIASQRAAPLESITREKINSVLLEIKDLLRLFEAKYFNTHQTFHVVGASPGAISLLRTIRDGLRYDEKIFERHKAGNFYEKDFRQEP